MRGVFESLICFGIMTGLLLPARLLFVEYISDDWLGSFGIISVISISIIILAKKQKLGFFGSMLERQIHKFQKGKRGILIFGESVFLLTLLGTTIIAIDQGNSVYSDLKLQNDKNLPSNPVQVQILEITKDWTAVDWMKGYVIGIISIITNFPAMSAAIASIDEASGGWLLHFYTVGFVEYIELLGIFIFYRIFVDNKLVSKIP
ncbi:hypothetical protein K0U27_09195 [archaeon]|nr:hypothetical protein [archaeon]